MKVPMALPYTGSDWIAQLPQDVRAETLHCMRPRVFEKGDIIYAEGRRHNALWQVRQGSVRVTNQTPDGKEVLFALFSVGDCFGEISLLDGHPAANTATAAERVELAELSRGDFDELYQRHPAFAQQLLKLMCGRVRHMLNFYAEVTLRPLEQRIASRILYLRADDGQEGVQALQFTQQDLANMVGATRQAVSKVLNQWREQGIISLEYGGITVHDPTGLQAILDG